MKSIDLIELDYLSTLEIIGEGAIDLLQGQITSDMQSWRLLFEDVIERTPSRGIASDEQQYFEYLNRSIIF